MSTTWFLDNTATGGLNNGGATPGATSGWANAWVSFQAMYTGSPGPAYGDTVYIAGGPSGQSQTYLAGSTLPNGGQFGAVNGVTYQIGQDALHNGTAILDGGGTGNMGWLIQDYVGVTINGNAGDGQQHIKLLDNSFNTAIVGFGWSGVHVTYVNFGKILAPGSNGGGASLNPIGGPVEIDHTYMYINSTMADHGIYFACSSTGYDSSMLFHDNVIWVPRVSSGNGFGADAIQGEGYNTGIVGGFSIYNNTLSSYPCSPTNDYSGNQHQDGWQCEGANWVKCYNNRITDMANYGIYPENMMGYSNTRIYNNIIVCTYGGGQAIGFGGGGYLISGCSVDNNLFDGYAFPLQFRVEGDPSDTGSFVNCTCYNNVAVTGSVGTIQGNIAQAGNVSGLNTSSWLSYAVNYSGNNYHLTALATGLIGQGTNLYSLFTGDFAGVQRSPTALWDIGPYAYLSGVLSSPVLKRLANHLKFPIWTTF